MSSVSTLTFISQQIIIYLGISIVVAGVLGGLLNAIVFLSLQTFRQSPCALYLTVASIVNIGQLLTGLLSRVMISGFGLDFTQQSLFYCKFRFSFYQICALVSFTCMCLASIDQFLATCSKPRWQQWSNLKIARRACLLTILICIIHSIPNFIYYDLRTIPGTGQAMCSNFDSIILSNYNRYFYMICLLGFIPILIMSIFALLAYNNVRNIAYRTVPLVRHQLDKQLTAMVLLQIIINVFTTLPFIILSTVQLIITVTDPVQTAVLQLILGITTCLYNSYFAVSMNTI
jgi:hypothetical protein